MDAAWMPVIDARSHGATGDGATIDSDAINRALDAAALAGGGSVHLPAGRYLCFSIRLRSNVALLLGEGATIVAADPALHHGAYDLPEPNPHDLYQDFGHSHWRNSLIWGDGIENAAILGPGMIDGNGLTRHGPGARAGGAGSHPETMRGVGDDTMRELEPTRAAMRGLGNKAIALRMARDISLAGFTISRGGHCAILASGCTGLTIDRLHIDTERDGIDIDSCRGVRITDCTVNTPNDDAIVLKASCALGPPSSTEDVTIARCTVSGYDLGTMLDGNFARTQEIAPDLDRVTGRIKIGTESNGNFRDIRITDCRFERSRGLAIETVDGGIIEDISVARLTMREVTSAPIFLRTGDRRRGPAGTGVGAIRRVTIDTVDASGIDPRFAACIAGLPDSPIEDVVLSNVRLSFLGGGTTKDAARIVPEGRALYPEPSMFGTLPAYGLYVRHARDIVIDGIQLETVIPDMRPPIMLDDVAGFVAMRLEVAAVEQAHRGFDAAQDARHSST